MSGEELQERMTDPSPGLVNDIRALDGDILIIGAGGKLGPTVARLAVRAVAAAGSGIRVLAASRFTERGLANQLRSAGAETIEADIADGKALRALPDAPNIVYLLGMKFGTTGREGLTWATNTYLPGRVAERYPNARIVALSTGNVYPYQEIARGGATEVSSLGPVGEYAMSCLGRERILAHFAEVNGTRLSIVRLNYSVEMRYGVLVDIAQKILASEPVDVSAGQVNVVWQGYAAEVTLRSLLRATNPPFVLNVTGPESSSVRQLGTAMAAALGRPVTFAGSEPTTALLSNASRCHALFGYPAVTVSELVAATAEWVRDGGDTLGKPTKFDRVDGRF